jgi:hypothetical protein
MSKKLMILEACTLIALALTALPSASSAGEFISHCSPGAVCEATYSGGVSTLEDSNGNSIQCSSGTGTVAVPSGTSTGTASLTAHGCIDENTSFSCTSGASPGTLHTGSGLVAHLVYIDATPTSLVGVLVTNLNMTFTCAGGFVKKTVTGSVIAVIENPECGKPRSIFSGQFASKAPTGSQQYTQVTTTGAVFNLTSGSETADAAPSSISGTGSLTFKAPQTVTLTC